MQICEDELETGAFPRWHAADLVQCPVGVQGYREKKMEMKMEETKAGEEVEMEGDMANHPEL